MARWVTGLVTFGAAVLMGLTVISAHEAAHATSVPPARLAGSRPVVAMALHAPAPGRRDVDRGRTAVAPRTLLTVTLPVTVLPTTTAVAVPRPSPPARVTVVLPKVWAHAIGAYWAGEVLLAPVGWTGWALIGADGSEEVVIHPPRGRGLSGERVVLDGDGACMGCGALDAARYFKNIRDRWAAYAAVPGQAPPAPVPVASEVDLAPDLVAYELPPEGRLRVDGVAYTGLLRRRNSPTFVDVRTYLPAEDHGMATVILNWAITHDLGR